MLCDVLQICCHGFCDTFPNKIPINAQENDNFCRFHVIMNHTTEEGKGEQCYAAYVNTSEGEMMRLVEQ